jgi:HSP20 family protein
VFLSIDIYIKAQQGLPKGGLTKHNKDNYTSDKFTHVMSLFNDLLREPFEDALGRRFDRLFAPTTLLVGDTTDVDTESQQRQAPPGTVSSWGPERGLQGFLRAPRLDLSEQGNTYVVRLDLPGVAKEDIDISLDDSSLLTITGTREKKSEEAGESYFRQERTFGRFQRRVRLPADAEGDTSKAELVNGVLTLTVPKKAEEQLRKKIRID